MGYFRPVRARSTTLLRKEWTRKGRTQNQLQTNFAKMAKNLVEKYKSYKNSSEFKGLLKLYALRNYFCPGYILSRHVVLVLRLPKVRCDDTVWKSLNVCQGYQNFTYSKDTRV